MHQRLSILAALFYLTVVLYHPMVMLSHMGMHAFQSSSHHQVHIHHHDDIYNDSQVIHTHGHSESEDSQDVLVQIVFQCLLLKEAEPQIISSSEGSKISCAISRYLGFNPNQHTPPPKLLLI